MLKKNCLHEEEGLRTSQPNVPANLDLEQIEQAAELIRRGELVAFPTETVYGLGANALDPVAVRKVFEVKGRPATSPLIVHVCSVEMARELAQEWPEKAERLAGRFWPGPLTMVLPKKECVPDEVTAGLPTVGLRMPAHPVALELIRRAGVPIAAPSANPFSRLSPTTAEHVRRQLGDKVAMVLDGGPTQVGIESTVVSLVEEPPRILRPGMISRRDLEEVIGPVVSDAPVLGEERGHPSPGLHPRHYSPRTKLIIVEGGRLPKEGLGAYLWYCERAPAAVEVKVPARADEYARVLYRVLHELDEYGLDWIAVEKPPEGDEWEGVRDRLKRAASG